MQVFKRARKACGFVVSVIWYRVVGLQKNQLWEVSTKIKAERGLGCRLVDLRAVRIRKWLQRGIPVLLMFRDVVEKAHMENAHSDGDIECFGLAISL